MKTQSLKNRILSYLEKHGGWVASGEIQRRALDVGYSSPQNAGRRCRELVEDEKLEVEYRHGHAWYRAKTPKQRSVYYVNLPEGRKEIVTYE